MNKDSILIEGGAEFDSERVVVYLDKKCNILNERKLVFIVKDFSLSLNSQRQNREILMSLTIR